MQILPDIFQRSPSHPHLIGEVGRRPRVSHGVCADDLLIHSVLSKNVSCGGSNMNNCIQKPANRKEHGRPFITLFQTYGEIWGMYIHELNGFSSNSSQNGHRGGKQISWKGTTMHYSMVYNLNTCCATAQQDDTQSQWFATTLAKELDQLLRCMIEDPKGVLLHARGQEHPCLACRTWHPTWLWRWHRNCWLVFGSAAGCRFSDQLKETTESLPLTTSCQPCAKQNIDTVLRIFSSWCVKYTTQIAYARRRHWIKIN